MKEHIEQDRFVEAVSSNKTGKTLENVKFFLGSDRNITQEQLCREAANALTQVSLGSAVKVEKLDSDMTPVSINDFIN